MNNPTEIFKSRTHDRNETGVNYIGIKNNLVVCRIAREDKYDQFWVVRDINGEYLYRDQYRQDVFDWVENRFN